MIRINTYVEATKQNNDIINSVIGQMSDGIWENTRSMEKYWKSITFKVEDGLIVLIDRDNVCQNLLDFIANKIKQIIKIEIDDGARLEWSRSCSAISNYLDRGDNIVTVGDCYKLYDELKGRNVSKYAYASYKDYTVTFDYQGQTIEVVVKATNSYQARIKAIEKISEKARVASI